MKCERAERTGVVKMKTELKTGWYNKNLNEIYPEDKEIGTILYVTKEFKHLYSFIDTLNFDKLSKKLHRNIQDIIIDVSNFWCDLTIKIYTYEV